MSSSNPYRDGDIAASFLPPGADADASPRSSLDSTSTTSLILERIGTTPRRSRYDDPDDAARGGYDDPVDLEAGPKKDEKQLMEKKMRRIVYIVAFALIGAWVVALIVYLSKEAYKYQANTDDMETPNVGRTISMEQIQSGLWRPRKKGIQWIEGEQDL